MSSQSSIQPQPSEEVAPVSENPPCLNAIWVQINLDPKGQITTIITECHHEDGSSENEEIQIKKVADHWEVISKKLMDDAHFDLSNSAVVRYLIEGLELILKQSGDLYLSGEYSGSLQIDYSGKVVIEKGRSLKISENLFLNKADLFENAGSLEVGKDCLCLVTGIRNMGKIIIRQGWQDFSVQTFENMASGECLMLRADIMSSTKIINQGLINCVLDFNGEPCEFINHAGEVNIGGNAILKSLTNKSETEPAINAKFAEVKRVLQDAGGKEIPSGDARQFLLKCDSAMVDPKGSRSPDCYTEGFRSRCLGCKRTVTSAQQFSRKEGKASSFIVHGCLRLKQPSQTVCSLLRASSFEGKMSLRGFATNKQIATFVLKCTHTAYYRGNFFGGGGRTLYWDSFVHTGTQTLPDEIIPAVMEVLGSVIGSIDTYINGKADKAQPGVVKTTEAALAQCKEKMQAITTEADIFPMLVNPEAYEKDLSALKDNPKFITMVRLQQTRRARSEASSELPSRQGSPGV